MSYEIADFQNDVLKRSHELPVLVDFWAEWCGPCKILGPILERLAAESGGRWILTKVDTEKFQDVAAEYGIRGIPNVKLFVAGIVVDEFTGALPESAVVLWLKKSLPDRFRKDIEQARTLLEKPDTAGAQSLLEEILQKDPDNHHVRVLLAGSLIASNAEKAMHLVAEIEEDSEHFQTADAIRTIILLSTKALRPESLPDDSVKLLYVGALEQLSLFNYDAALEKFIEVLRTNRQYDDDGARKACIAIFRLLGENHGVTLKRRREFSSALYA